MGKKVIKIIGVTVLIFSLYSCNKSNSLLDFSNSWIYYYQYKDVTGSNGKLIQSDTITVSLNDVFFIRVKTQSNDGSTPQIFKQINDNDFINITNCPLEASIESDYRESRGYRQINLMHIELYETLYSKGDIIRYKTTISSLNGLNEKTIFLKIK